MSTTQMSGFVRSTSPANYGDGSGALCAVNNRGDLLVAQSLPPMVEGVRLGDTWEVSIATGSAFTHVAAWPTTRAELVLYNGEPSVGKSYVIESVWAAAISSIAAASAYTLIGQVVPTGTAPTDDAAQLITSRSGKPTYTGKARRAVANTAFAVASKWSVLETVPAGAAASIGLAAKADLQGGIILPPGAILCLNLVVGTAFGTGSIGVVWSERQLVLG